MQCQYLQKEVKEETSAREMSALEKEALAVFAFMPEQSLHSWEILRRFCDFQPYSPHLLPPLHCLLQQFWVCLHCLEAMLDAASSSGDAGGHLAMVAAGGFPYLCYMGLLQRRKYKRVQEEQKNGMKQSPQVEPAGM